MTTQLVSLLEGYEASIEQGLRSYIQAGEALEAIRDGKLYRSTYATFEAYCQHRWGWTPQHARRMLEASVVARGMEPTGSIPATERHARELTGLAPETASQVLASAAADTAGKVTAQSIRTARLHIVGDRESPPPPAMLEPEIEPEIVDAELVDTPKPTITPAERDRQARLEAEHWCSGFALWVNNLLPLQHQHMRSHWIDQWRAGSDGASPTQRGNVTPATMRQIADGLRALANEWN